MIGSKFISSIKQVILDNMKTAPAFKWDFDGGGFSVQ